MIEGYAYKIIFDDGCWYWGTSQYKGVSPETDGYYGSPVTHKLKWKNQHSKIVLKLFQNEQKRLEYENLCIKPDLNDPKCLNEHAGLAFSRAVHNKSKGVPRTPEVRNKISLKNRGLKRSPIQIQKLKDAVRPPITLETITKIVESRKGYRHSSETIEKIRKGNKGKKRSEELRERIAESIRGFKWYNNGVESVQAHSHPGIDWMEGRIMDWKSPRNAGMKWYHKNGERRMSLENPGDGWIPGTMSKGKRYYNNGSDHVLAFECPGEGWVLGRLKRK